MTRSFKRRVVFPNLYSKHVKREYFAYISINGKEELVKVEEGDNVKVGDNYKGGKVTSIIAYDEFDLGI